MDTDNKEETKQKLMEKVNGDIAPVDAPTTDVAPFMAMDAADDEQILSEVKGKGATVAEEWIYSFEQDGKEITGLSWMGTKNAAFWLARKNMAKLKISNVDVKPDPTDPEYMLCSANAEDSLNGVSTFGFKRQWTKLKRRDGSLVTNPFWYEQGTSKAMRNAMQSLMPADWITLMIKEWVDQGKIKKLDASRVNVTGGVATTDPKKKFWARYYSARSYEEMQQILTDLNASTLLDSDKFIIKKKVMEKMATFSVPVAPDKSDKVVEPDDDIPF